MKTPLAWFNLSHDRVRFLLFVLGIVFAVVLMFIQLGFKGALLDSQTLLHEKLNADLVLVSPNRQAIAMRETIPRRRLLQAKSVPGVAEVHPLFVDNNLGYLLDTSSVDKREPSRAIRVVGLNPQAQLLKLPELAGDQARDLQTPGNAFYDRATAQDTARPGATVFGPLMLGTETELAGGKVRFVGSVALGPDFTTDGTIIVSEETFSDRLRRPFTFGAPLADVDLGLVRLMPGADREAVQEAIRAALSVGQSESDVEVLTVREYTLREQGFWLNNTPIGFAFDFGMFMGFAVGTVICYQILSGDVADHLAEYATLKALGYPNRALAWIVVQESLILAFAGFVIGIGISYLCYLGLTDAVGMPFRLGRDRILTVFVATIIMCVASGLLALVRLVRADPADVF
jgi:putative ABC transport system permease protein